MRKRLIAAGALGMFAAAAHAESSVTIYGIYDAGLRYLHEANAAGQSSVSMGSNGTSTPNRLGFKGVEELGGGLSAHFNLETGWNAGNGALESTTGSPITGNRALFQRLAIVGISHVRWGTIDLGQNYSVGWRTSYDYDPFNYRYPTIDPVSAIVPGSSVSQVTAGVRFHNDVQYTGVFGPITVRAEHAFGNVAGAVTANTATAGSLAYKSGPLVIAGSYTTRKIATTGGVFTGTPAVAGPPAVAGEPTVNANTPTYADRSWSAGAAYRFGSVRVSAGYNDERLAGALNNVVAGLPLTPAQGDTRVRVGWFGANWTVSPFFNLAAGWFRTLVDTPIARAAGAASGTSGKKDLLMFAATWSLSKTTYLYGEIDRTALSGNQVLGYGTKTTQRHPLGVSTGLVVAF
ncbi:porin [Paraburkholderia kururiensis]|uniref:porin n=1 Tax=Paraburkholderia kururiensis TaxID=984307 RepID=UPI0018F319DC|nr:porin [Paraburkholderia kururiensis]